MKLCPNCKTLNDDSERYCTKCRYKLDTAEFVPNPKIQKKHYIAFIILIAAIAAAIIIAFVAPKLFVDKSKQNFAQGYIDMLPSRSPASGISVQNGILKILK